MFPRQVLQDLERTMLSYVKKGVRGRVHVGSWPYCFHLRGIGVQKRKAFQAESASHWIRIATCFGFVFLFIFVGCAVLMYYEGWDVIDAIFFCVVTLTTVGG
jgi:Trk-type K+ transport system membrane component